MIAVSRYSIPTGQDLLRALAKLYRTEKIRKAGS